MKRITSLFLLALFLFNLGGYQLIFEAMHIRADRALQLRLDVGQYSSDELMVVAIPLTLPYPVGSGDYEYYNGKFEHQGRHYRFVEQRFENDTLFIACIPDVGRDTLKQVENSVKESTTEDPQRANAELAGKYFKDYNSTDFRILLKRTSLFTANYFAFADRHPGNVSPDVVAPPPEHQG